MCSLSVSSPCADVKPRSIAPGAPDVDFTSVVLRLWSFFSHAAVAERDNYLQLYYYEHAPQCRLDYRNGYYFRDFLTRLGRLSGLRIPRTRKGFRSQILPRYQRRQAAVNPSPA
jgi:transposase-like protein